MGHAIINPKIIGVYALWDEQNRWMKPSFFFELLGMNPATSALTWTTSTEFDCQFPCSKCVSHPRGLAQWTKTLNQTNATLFQIIIVPCIRKKSKLCTIKMWINWFYYNTHLYTIITFDVVISTMASLSAPRSYGKAPPSLATHPADGSTPQRSWREPGEIPTSAGDRVTKFMWYLLLAAHVFLLLFVGQGEPHPWYLVSKIWC